MTTLYLGFDFFHPRVYTRAAAGGEIYDHDDNAWYFVVQPLVIGTADLVAYFANGSADAVEVLTAAHPRKDAPDKYPVPLPLRTKLKVEWSRNAIPGSIETVVSGGDSQLLLDRAGWVEFAKRNALPVPVKSYGGLTHAQRATFERWAYALTAGLRATPPQTKGVPQSVIDSLARLSEQDFEKWLAAFRPTIGAELFETVYAKLGAEEVARLRPPKFICEDANFDVCASDYFAGSPESYTHWLWTALAPRIADTSSRDETANALTRLFGFGERLRWPARDSSRLIVLRDKDEFTPPWSVTNAHSLLGLVFRIETTTAEPFERLSLSLNGGPAVTAVIPNPQAGSPPLTVDSFHAGMNRLRESVAQWNGTSFSAALARDPAAPDGRDMYHPRTAVAEPGALRIRHAADERVVAPVPGALLDLLDPFARIESKPATWPGWPSREKARIVQHHPPRLFLYTDDLFNDGGYAPLNVLDGVTPRYEKVIRISATLRPMSVAGVAGDEHLYELRISHDVNPDDGPVLAAAVDAIVAGAQAWLAIPKQAGLPEGHYDLGAGRPVRGTAAWSLVIGDKRGSLGTAISNDYKSLDATRGIAVDIVVGAVVIPGAPPAVPNGGKTAFNALAFKPAREAPPVVLKCHFDHTVSPSTEGIFERFVLSLTPAVRLEDPVLSHLGNFNKLRLALVDAGSPVPDYRQSSLTDDPPLVLTFPDALVPLAPAPAAAPLCGTVVNFRPAGGSSASTFWYKVAHSFVEPLPTGAATATERSSAARAAEGKYYSVYRRAADADRQLAGTVEHQYGHRIEVRSGKLRIPCTTEVANLASQVVRARPLDAAGGGAAQEGPRLAALVFDHKTTANRDHVVVQLAVDYLKTLLAKSDVDGEYRPSGLRPLHEALSELANGTATLELERWCFSNAPRLRTDAKVELDSTDERQELPGIVAHMRCEETLLIDASPMVARLRLLLGSSFTDFEQNVKNEVAAGADIDLLDFDQFAVALHRTTDAIRLGLRVRRSAAAAYGRDDVRKLAYTPLPRPRRDVSPAEQAVLDCEYSGLQSTAGDDLVKYVSSTGPDPSPLVEAFAWLTSRDTDVNPPAGAGESVELRREKIYGDAFRYLNFPNGLRDPITKPTTLFYIPHAFLPLRTHESLGDPDTTREFAAYILAVLGDIVDAGSTTLLDLLPVAADDALAARRDARALLVANPDRPGIGARLASLIRPVHDPANNAPVFQRAVAQLKHIQTLDQESLQKRLEAMCAANPAIFGLAKGFGVAVFDPATFRQELYALQMHKTIPHAGGASRGIDDIDEFLFNDIAGVENDRYFVDVLDDVTYPDRFMIGPSTSLARTAEDVIEQVNKFSETKGNRSLHVEVTHYNPSWKNGGREFYVLPSRRFPPIPVPILPRLDDAAGDDSPWHTRISAFAPDDDTRPVDVSRKRFRELLSAALPATVVLPAPSEGPKVSAARVANSFALTSQTLRDWYRVDTYLSVYYFIVQGDEEAAGGDAFANDRYEIEVETATTPFPAGVPRTNTSMALRSPLQQWFAYHRTRTQHPSTQQPPPAAVPVDRVVREIRQWCVAPAENPSLTAGQELLQGRSLKPEVPSAVRLSGYQSASGSPWTLTLSGGSAETVGTAVAADLLSFTTDDAPDADRVSQRILRVAVLDEPWRYTRARLRVIRNAPDIGGDMTPDVAQEFRMTETSDWVAYGRHFMQVRGEELPAEVRELHVLPAAIGRDDWLSATGPVDLGPVVVRAMKRAADATGGVDSSIALWAAAPISRPDLVARGEVLQVVDSAFPRVLRDTIRIGGTDSQRLAVRQELVKQYLAPERPAPDLARLASSVDKSRVRTADPYLRVTWFTTSPDRVPLFQVTWPVVWQN